jgi:hypothetical protein
LILADNIYIFISFYFFVSIHFLFPVSSRSYIHPDSVIKLFEEITKPEYFNGWQNCGIDFNKLPIGSINVTHFTKCMENMMILSNGTDGNTAREYGDIYIFIYYFVILLYYIPFSFPFFFSLLQIVKSN